jgi:hypothetical protein
MVLQAKSMNSCVFKYSTVVEVIRQKMVVLLFGTSDGITSFFNYRQPACMVLNVLYIHLRSIQPKF